MCVILAVDGKRPTMDLLQKAFKHNDDGAGIAWIDDGMIQFQKDTVPDKIMDLAMKVPIPFIVHFRIASVGKSIPALCHPFPISPNAPTVLKGSATAVLFHNGNWFDWEQHMLKHAITTCREIPDGPWSDSRAAAWIAHRTGPNLLQFITGKFAVINVSGITLYGDYWVHEDGIHFSNKFFDTTTSTGFSTCDYDGGPTHYPATHAGYTSGTSYKRNFQATEPKQLGLGKSIEADLGS